MGIIRLEQIKLHGFHGLLPEEKIIGNTFCFDVEIEIDLESASQSDAIVDTYNYQQAYDIVLEEASQPSNLLEHLAGRIINRILASSKAIEVARIKVSKMNPPFGGDVNAVSVELSQKQNQ